MSEHVNGTVVPTIAAANRVLNQDHGIGQALETATASAEIGARCDSFARVKFKDFQLSMYAQQYEMGCRRLATATNKLSAALAKQDKYAIESAVNEINSLKETSRSLADSVAGYCPNEQFVKPK